MYTHSYSYTIPIPILLSLSLSLSSLSLLYQARKLEEERADAAPTLDVPRYKALWADMAVSGQFNAKVRQIPSLAGITEHMKKQGFHVVFTTALGSQEVELGLCNVRTGPQDKWFLARFLATPTDFSAVMKTEDPAGPGKYVNT